MLTVGIRELKNRLTYYLNAAKKGDNIVVTERGTPVAIMHNLDRTEEKASVEERMAVLSREGLISLPKKKVVFPPVKRVLVKGVPVSETIISERR
jgi:antitoxin (DNA-binding transcriptional repressor) of toxin-antitoxin stability system